MKTVFKSSEISHIWAHAHENPAGPMHGRCPGNLSFETQLPNLQSQFLYAREFSSVLKSYSTVIARIVPGNGKHKKEFCALLNSRHYSRTTSGSQSAARRATQHLTQFRIEGGWRGDTFNFTGQQVFDALKSSGMRHVESAHKPRILARTRESLLASARLEFENANQAREFFALRCKPIDPAALAVLRPDLLAKHKVQAAQQAANDKARREQLAARKKQIVDLLASLAPVALANWRNRIEADICEPLRALGHYRKPSLAVAPGNCALRLNSVSSEALALGGIPTRVETSQGAQVLLRTVKFLGQLCARVKTSGQAMPASEIAALPVLDNYTISEIDADGNVRVGCHFIAFSEIQSINSQTEENSHV